MTDPARQEKPDAMTREARRVFGPAAVWYVHLDYYCAFWMAGASRPGGDGTEYINVTRKTERSARAVLLRCLKAMPRWSKKQSTTQSRSVLR